MSRRTSRKFPCSIQRGSWRHETTSCAFKSRDVNFLVKFSGEANVTKPCTVTSSHATSISSRGFCQEVFCAHHILCSPVFVGTIKLVCYILFISLWYYFNTGVQQERTNNIEIELVADKCMIHCEHKVGWQLWQAGARDHQTNESPE